MNTRPNAIRVLCYGDCNVYGLRPIIEGRYPSNLRWTGILQKILGDKYEIIEEGLVRRNSGFEDPDYKGMNALSYLTPCLLSQNPIDWIVLWIGTRDHKDKFNLSVGKTAKNIEKIITECQKTAISERYKKVRIILIAPTLVTRNIHKFSDRYNGAIYKSTKIASLFRSVSKKTKTIFVDASKITEPSILDGMHLDIKGHKKIGEAIYKIIKKV
jgi:lysophospholipase L1-like esterase